MQILIDGQVVEGVSGFEGLQQIITDVLYGNLHGAIGGKFNVVISAEVVEDAAKADDKVRFTSAVLLTFEDVTQ